MEPAHHPARNQSKIVTVRFMPSMLTGPEASSNSELVRGTHRPCESVVSPIVDDASSPVRFIVHYALVLSFKPRQDFFMSFHRATHRSQKRSRGQALVEFALVIPAFMLILGGVIQFGILFWDQNTLNQIVRDAGRYAATVTNCTTGPADIVTRTQQLEAQTPFAGTYGTVTVVLPGAGSTPVGVCPPATNADVVWVTITAEATVPIFFPLVNGAISSTATYRMEPVIP